MLRNTGCALGNHRIPENTWLLHASWRNTAAVVDKFEEDRLKIIRERETRTINHKACGAYEKWQAPSHHHLLKDYNRAEIEQRSAAQVPHGFDFPSLFKYSRRANVRAEDTNVET